MDLTLLAKIIPVCRKNGVRSLKMEGFEVAFRAPCRKKKKTKDVVATAETKVEGPSLFEALKEFPQSMEQEMSVDKILHWSAPGGDESDDRIPVPLTNDAPLGD